MYITFAFLLKIACASHSFIIKKIRHLLFFVSVSGKKVHKNCYSYVFRNWHNSWAYVREWNCNARENDNSFIIFQILWNAL